ncbi:MAG: site-specific DNA-methyltransferase, partial [Tannerella sp.]|nr:site-specific DNA-methyltransferase [Tannerella sp.]
VFDPFSGSGSTAIACINTNRRFIACEIDGEYYHSSHERIQNHLREKQKEVKQPALF